MFEYLSATIEIVYPMEGEDGASQKVRVSTQSMIPSRVIRATVRFGVTIT